MGDSSGSNERPVSIALDALLRQQPNALVAAVGDDGLFVDMPASVPLGHQHAVPAARWALDLVGAVDRPAVIDAWVRSRNSGAAQVNVTLAATGAPATISLFDVREEHGACVAVFVTEGGDPVVVDAVAGVVSPPPRVAHTHKDEVATIVGVEPAMTAMLGWPADDIVGQNSLAFIHPEDSQRAIDLWMECLARPGSTCSTRLRHKHHDGHWVWVEMTNTNRLADEGHVDCQMVDITEEMEALEAVRASEQLLRRLAASLPVGVARFDVDHRILYANERLYEILGAPLDANDRSLCSAAVDAHVLESAMELALRDGSDVDTGIEVDRLDGTGRRQCTISVRSLSNDESEIVGGVLVLVDVTEQSRLRRELERRATYDSLTGCVNRQVAIGQLTDALDPDRRTATDCGTAAIFLDLDGFKDVNDLHGHATGDAVLTTVAERLRAAVRHGDVVGRLGGDEFLVVCPDVADETATRVLAERLASAVAEPIVAAGRRLRISASVGASWTRRDQGVGADALIAEADIAMYRAKRTGSGVVLSS